MFKKLRITSFKRALGTSAATHAPAASPFASANAVVSYNTKDKVSLNWQYEPIKVRTALRDHDMLVELKYVGICHTDIALGLSPNQYPRVLGHEGVGIVKKVGQNVSNANVGDRVVLRYSYCGDCNYCNVGDVAYCSSSAEKNLFNTDRFPGGNTFSDEEGNKIGGKFFGQSSFASLSVVDEASVVNIEKLGKVISDAKLKFLGPFGCGFQTGAGAILNAGQLKNGETVVIYGLGSVGFAGLFAAKIGGAGSIIAVDLMDSKLELAKQLGATHLIKASREDPEYVGTQIRELTNGRGPDLSLECIGGSKLVEKAVENSASKGRIVVVGVGSPDDKIQLPLSEFLLSGKQLISCIEGNAIPQEFIPQEFIPQMIQWFLDGKFPVDKIVNFYKVEDYETALKDMKNGSAIKPVLEF